MVKPARRRWRSFVLQERGATTLVELLVVIPMMMAVIGATLGLYDFSVKDQARTEDRAHALIDQKNGMEKMSRELRTAISVKYQTSEIVDAQLASTKRWVRYDCSAGSCKRSEGPTQGSFTAGPVTVVDSVQSADFQLLAENAGALEPNYIDPTYVTITLRVAVPGATNPIVLNDGFNLRNLTGLS
jgi:Tfp pilus assembly protein PilW